ncbi:MAG: ROK family protein [Actinomycetota bacterium]|nr:ROK family protein [Actinomycetota bacterium]
MTDRYLGLDLGGTNIKVAVLEKGEGGFQVVSTSRTRTGSEGGPGAVTDNLVAAAREALEVEPEIASIGLGVPGLFDRDRGTIELFPNLPGDWAGYPLRSRLEQELGREIWMVNDARAFTLAEGTMGAGAGCHIVVCVTLGTGVGGGIMIDGRLHGGAFGVAGELGHQTIVPDGPLCGCGNRGCVEALTRADVLTSLAGKETAEEVYSAAGAGEEKSLAAIRQVAEYLGIGLANVVTLLGPDRIIIGGGIADAGELVLGPIREAVRARVTLVPIEQIDVVAASLGAVAGALGAALAGVLRP